MTQATITRTTMEGWATLLDDERTAVGRKFLDALTARDFSRLSGLLGSTMRMRALLPTGPYEFRGWRETLDAFSSWFGEAEDFEVHLAELDLVADRLEMRWQFGLRLPGERTRRTVEQRVYCKVENGQTVVMDLLCTGFRPVELAA